MPMFKICGSCGKKLETGTKCKCQIRNYSHYDKKQRDKTSKAFYDSAAWLKTRNYVLELDGMDVYAFMTTGEIIAADTVHHIEPLRDCPEKKLDISNLMSLHHDTHSMIEQFYKKKKKEMILELSSMLNEFRRGRGC